jgi:hypothetical protein
MPNVNESTPRLLPLQLIALNDPRRLQIDWALKMITSAAGVDFPRLFG